MNRSALASEEGTQLFLRRGESIIVRESDDELYALILAEQGQEPPPVAALDL